MRPGRFINSFYFDMIEKSLVAWACGAVGSALPWHGRGREFESHQVHQTLQALTRLPRCLTSPKSRTIPAFQSLNRSSGGASTALRSSQNRCTDMPLRSCSAIRSRQYSLLAPIFFPLLALVMAPLCDLPDDFGRGVYQTLTMANILGACQPPAPCLPVKYFRMLFARVSTLGSRNIDR